VNPLELDKSPANIETPTPVSLKRENLPNPPNLTGNLTPE